MYKILWVGGREHHRKINHVESSLDTYTSTNFPNHRSRVSKYEKLNGTDPTRSTIRCSSLKGWMKLLGNTKNTVCHLTRKNSSSLIIRQLSSTLLFFAISNHHICIKDRQQVPLLNRICIYTHISAFSISYLCIVFTAPHIFHSHNTLNHSANTLPLPK